MVKTDAGEGTVALLRMALGHLPAVIWTTDSELRFTMLTGSGLSAVPLDIHRLLGHTLFEYFGTKSRALPPIAAHLSALEGETVVYEHEWGGRTFTSTVQPMRDEGGRIAGCVAMATDITERKKTEQALRETTSKLEAIFHAFPDLYFQLDSLGTYLGFHAGKEADLFAPPETFLGRTIRDIMPGELGERLQQSVEHAVEHRELTTVEYDLPLPGGRQSFECRVSPMIGNQALAIVRNVTERRSLEEQLLQSQKMEAVGRLAGGVAHDFNNVLTAILGYCHMLMAPLPAHDPQSLKLDQIRRAAERAAELTSQLLAFSRRQILQPRVVSLNVIVGELEPMLTRLLGEDVRVVSQLGDALGAVRVDPGQVGQVVMNLLVNARDAMPNGGTVTVSTSNADVSGRPPHPSMTRGAYVLLEVADTGTGMDAATLDRIYEPFFTTKGSGHGTGLGLSTVYGIVQQSGGVIVAESELGRGATFRVYFPRVTEAFTAESARPEPMRVAGRGERVLLAEDETEVRELVAEILRSEGYVVMEATDGVDALSVAARESGTIDLLVADLVMPRKGGRDLAAALRREHPKLKVLYVSGYASTALSSGELEPGASYLQKPFHAEVFTRRVSELLDS